jgi:hypothetical protein
MRFGRLGSSIWSLAFMASCSRGPYIDGNVHLEGGSLLSDPLHAEVVQCGPRDTSPYNNSLMFFTAGGRLIPLMVTRVVESKKTFVDVIDPTRGAALSRLTPATCATFETRVSSRGRTSRKPFGPQVYEVLYSGHIKLDCLTEELGRATASMDFDDCGAEELQPLSHD